MSLKCTPITLRSRLYAGLYSELRVKRDGGGTMSNHVFKSFCHVETPSSQSAPHYDIARSSEESFPGVGVRKTRGGDSSRPFTRLRQIRRSSRSTCPCPGTNKTLFPECFALPYRSDPASFRIKRGTTTQHQRLTPRHVTVGCCTGWEGTARHGTSRLSCLQVLSASAALHWHA